MRVEVSRTKPTETFHTAIVDIIPQNPYGKEYSKMKDKYPVTKGLPLWSNLSLHLMTLGVI